MIDLLAALNKRIEYIRADNWGPRESLVVRLSEKAGQTPDGSLAGAVEVLAPKRNGELVVIQSRSLNGVASEQEIDDILAEVLSVALSQHDKWPR